ncbi:MAG: family 43 glycosylhydrolase [Bacteroidales bacterium]|nr:family 43 glycosylhydrolase [Bacteroidales bacterium]
MNLSKSVVCLIMLGASTVLGMQAQTIHNDVFWDTSDGTPLYSQGGGIFKFPEPETGRMAYYWYGSHFKEAEQYRQDPSVTLERNSILGVSCYKSYDFVNWQDMGHVMTLDEITGGRRWAGWFCRMGVAYIEETKQYALLSQHNNSVMVALADKPTGPFKVHKHIDMKPMIGTSNTGDQTVFTDEDTGRDYLIYSYGNGRHKGYISEIGVLEDGTIGLKNCVEVFKGASREGNCMFKYRGKYYLCASNIYGWDSSFAYYLVSDSIYGPYQPVDDMQVMPGCERDYAHITQTGFFYTLRGTEQETVIYCGDRWCDFAGNGLGYNQWFPLSFQGDKPYFNSLSAWTLDAHTGLWQVHPDNNYVLNGSFEADRRLLPIPNKPRQEYMLGWDTKVLKGNAVSLDNPHTPHLNYLNTKEDRQHVIGEKSLCMSDSVDFDREVSQEVLSTPFVSVPDGDYELRLKFRERGKWDVLKVTVESGGKQTFLDLKRLKSNDQWTEAVLKTRIKGGKARIVFRAKGKAMAQCLVDDVELTTE